MKWKNQHKQFNVKIAADLCLFKFFDDEYEFAGCFDAGIVDVRDDGEIPREEIWNQFSL